MNNSIPRPSKCLTIFLFVFSAMPAAILFSACGDTVSTPIAGPTSTQSLVGGAALFMRYCNSCHPGGGRGAGPSLIGEDEQQEIRMNIRVGKGRMPAFNSKIISDEQLDELVEYVISLKP